MLTYEILIGFDDHMSLYVVTQDLAEQLLRTETNEQAIDMTVDGGTLIEQADEVDRGEVFLSYLEEDFGEFQNALMDLVCDKEAE